MTQAAIKPVFAQAMTTDVISGAYTFIEDPGHGWLKVDYREIAKLGLYGKISGYSYIDGTDIYLEEDCDLALFIEAKAAIGEPVFYNRVYQEYTQVRNMARFGGAA